MNQTLVLLLSQISIREALNSAVPPGSKPQLPYFVRNRRVLPPEFISGIGALCSVIGVLCVAAIISEA